MVEMCSNSTEINGIAINLHEWIRTEPSPIDLKDGVFEKKNSK